MHLYIMRNYSLKTVKMIINYDTDSSSGKIVKGLEMSFTKFYLNFNENNQTNYMRLEKNWNFVHLRFFFSLNFSSRIISVEKHFVEDEWSNSIWSFYHHYVVSSYVGEEDSDGIRSRPSATEFLLPFPFNKKK